MGVKRLSEGIEKTLTKDEHVKAIHYFDHEVFPEINYSLWKYERRAQDSVTALQDYIDAPCIEDTFGNDHVARRKWRDDVTARDQIIQQVLDDDVMGAGKYLNVYNHLEKLGIGYIGTNGEELAGLVSSIKGAITEEYHNLLFEQKLEMVYGIKRRAYDILQSLSAQNPVPECFLA